MGLHEVDALLTERVRLALGQTGRGARRRDGVGHVLAPSSGIGSIADAFVSARSVHYCMSPYSMSQNLTTHELDSPPWLRVESTLMATARLVRTAFDARLEPLASTSRRPACSATSPSSDRPPRPSSPTGSASAGPRSAPSSTSSKPAAWSSAAQPRRPARVARGHHAGRQRARRRDRRRRRGAARRTPARHRPRGTPGPRLGDDPPATEPAVRHRRSARSVRQPHHPHEPPNNRREP